MGLNIFHPPRICKSFALRNQKNPRAARGEKNFTSSTASGGRA
jgi:hypothetical protein